MSYSAVADPGFPREDANPKGGGMNLLRIAPLAPQSANAILLQTQKEQIFPFGLASKLPLCVRHAGSFKTGLQWL